MKKVIKNYLAKLQENDKKGFSLVELIIVMAIMAILVGIVASQVLPYMEKSRQSKDQQVLSGYCTDLVSAIAQSTEPVDDVDGQDITGLTAGTNDANLKKFAGTFVGLQNDTAVTAASLKAKLKSKEASKGQYSIQFDYSSGDGKVKVYLSGHSAGASGDKMYVESN